jgi:glucarate dehydratase
MAALRSRIDTPLATNMCVVAFEHLAPAVRLGSVDIVLADPHYWGGFPANLRMMAVCDAFGLSVGMHSDNDLGLSTAAKVHLAAISPELRLAIDTHHPEHRHDLLLERVSFTDGSFEVPTGPGLGVTLDDDAVAAYTVGR